MADQFMISNLVIDTTNVKGWTTHSIDPGVIRALNAGASELDPSTAQVTRVEPVFTGSTVDIKTILDLVFAPAAGAGTYMIPHVPITANQVDVHFTNVAAGGAHGGAGLNPRGRISKGIVVVTGLANNADGILEAQVSVYADYDGTNSPIVFSDENLPAFVTAPTLYVLRAIKNGSAGSVLHKLNNINIDFGINVTRQRPANSIYPTDSSVDGYRPTMTFSTDDLATALAASGLSGTTAPAGGLIVYLGKYDPTVPGVKATEALTLTFRGAADGTGSPWYTNGIPLGGNAPIALNYMVQGIGGTTLVVASSPLQYGNAGVSLPSESTDAAIFGPGPIAEAGAEKEVIDGNVDFGMNWQTRGSSALPWPTVAFLTRRDPVFTINTSDMDYVLGLGIEGREINTSFATYWRKYTQDGQPDAQASVHISLSCTGGLIVPTAIGGGHGQLLPSGFIVQPTGGLSLSVAASMP